MAARQPESKTQSILDSESAAKPNTGPVIVEVNLLPSDDTCFFSNRRTAWPSPHEIRKRAKPSAVKPEDLFRPDPVCFPNLGLIVKWGTDVTIAEGQCLWFLGKHLSEQVPVPEIYGWTKDGRQTFLYQQLILGDTLEERWPSLTENERSLVCQQLKTAMISWRRLEKKDSATPLSQIGDQPLRDIMFHDAGNYPAGPFTNLASFHDLYVRPLLSNSPTTTRSQISALCGLLDDTPICFTHNDLHQKNILVTKVDQGRVRLLAVIDWHQSGWYPEPWEWLKAQSVGYVHSEWVTKYIPMIMAQAGYDYFYSWEYVRMASI